MQSTVGASLETIIIFYKAISSKLGETVYRLKGERVNDKINNSMSIISI